MFGKDWLLNPSTKVKKHPAYKQWILCSNALNKQGNIEITGDNSNLIEFSKMLADSQFFGICTQGQLDNFSIGSLANYGDSKVQKRIKGVISNPSQYLNIITELSFAASQISKGNKINAYEELGFPDFSVSISGWQLPFAVDCKRLKRDTSNSRIGKIINKANKQVKAFGNPCYGLAVLDVSEKVNRNLKLSDEIPEEITALKSVVSKAISEFNTSISAVLLMWDDFTILGKPENGEKVITLWVRRRYELIQHKKPKYPLVGDLETISVGNTVMIAINVNTDNPFPLPMVWRPI